MTPHSGVLKKNEENDSLKQKAMCRHAPPQIIRARVFLVGGDDDMIM